MSYLILILIIFIIITGGVIFFFIFRKLRRQRFSQALNLKLLLVRLPQKAKSEEQPKDFKDEINLSAQLFGILSGLKSPFGLEAAVHNIGEEIHFYVAAPRESLNFVSRQIEGLWKEARVEEIDDYNIFNSNGVSQGVYFKQKTSYALPVRTYQEANVDTFAPILSGLSSINEVGEGAGLQILAKPAPSSAKKTISSMITELKKGMKLDDVLKGATVKLKDIKQALQPEKEKKEKEEKIIDEEAIKALEAKISKPLLAVNARILVSAPSQFQADSILESIAGGFSQFSAPLRNELKIIKPRDSQKLIYQFSFREFDDGQTMILNTEEIASSFHLPASTTELPRIKWLKAKEAAPPANLPKKGTLIGESVFRDERRPVFITEDDRRRHIYIIGQTGTGKSTLLTHMVADDIRQGKGVALIDPHGDLIEKILGLIPNERAGDVVLFDPSDMWKPLGMNMLEYDLNRPEQKTFIANEMINIAQKLFGAVPEAL